MTGPPRAALLNPKLHSPASMRARQAPPPRIGKRAVYVQCDKCGDHGTGRAVGARLVSCNLPTTFGYRFMTHQGCGGRFSAYDIAEGDQ